MRIAPVDHSGNVGSFTSPRIAASTGEVTRPDARNLDFNQQYTGGTDGAINIASSFVEIMSAGGTFVAGQTAFIHVSFVAKRVTTTFGDLIYRIFYDGSQLKSIGADVSFVTLGESLNVSYSLEHSPATGSHTYSVEAFFGGGQALFKKIIVNLHKR